MRSRRNRAIAAIVTTILLALPLATASAAPQGLASPQQAAEDSLLAQLWQWFAGLLGADGAGSGAQTSAVSTCSAGMASGRGCAIDPNGSF